MSGDKPVKWLGVGRSGWLRFQAGLAIVNGMCMWNHLDDRRYAAALLALTGVLITAVWRIPPPFTPRAQHSPTEDPHDE